MENHSRHSGKCLMPFNKNIYLIGYRCTGKTTTGRELAAMSDFLFLDIDEEIRTKMSMSIASIVENFGWEKFREIEQQILFKTDKLNPHIIATGGGIITLDENVRFMKKNGIVVWLKAPVNIITHRMIKDPETSDLRPSLTGKTVEDETLSVLNKRIPIYKNACDFEFDTSQLSPLEIAENIKQKIRLKNMKKER